MEMEAVEVAAVTLMALARGKRAREDGDGEAAEAESKNVPHPCSFIELLPPDLRREVLKYSRDVACVLDGTGWFRVSQKDIRKSRDMIAILAALWGNLPLLEWSRQQGYRLYAWIVAKRAAKRGDIGMLEYLLRSAQVQRSELSDSAFDAAEAGHIHVLRWLQSEQVPVDVATVCQGAVIGNSVEALALLSAHKLPAVTKVHLGIMAASYGHVELLAHLRSPPIGMSWSFSVYNEAAAQGRLEMVKYCHENGCPHDDGLSGSVFRTAAREGHVQVLEYLALSDKFNSDLQRASILRIAAQDLRTHNWLINHGYDSFIPS